MTVVVQQPNGCDEWVGGPVTESDVRRSIQIAREHGSRFFDQIVWQIENEAWTKVGYSSWDEMWDAEYEGVRVAVIRSDRPELVTRMLDAGLSQQQTADTLGVTGKTVQRDLKGQMSNEEPPATRTNSRGQERPASYASKPPSAPASEQKAKPEPDPEPPKPKLTEAEALAEKAEADQRAADDARMDAIAARVYLLDRAVDFLTEFAEWPERANELRDEYRPLYPTNGITVDKLRLAVDGLNAVRKAWAA